MARSLAVDLRERAVAAVLAGESCRSVAARFAVTPASVIRWLERQRQTGSVAPRQMGGVRRAALAGQRDWLLARITHKPDLTLAALAAELRHRGVVVAISVVWRFFRGEGISFKKKPPRRRTKPPDVARRRNRWQRRLGRLDPTRLVFIDETWAKTNMVRSHGRCAVGERLVDKTAHGHWKTLTFVAALRADRITAPAVFDGPINGRSFLAYVQQALAKALKPETS